MNNWEQNYGIQSKMRQSGSEYIQKGCSTFLTVIAIITWAGGFFLPLFTDLEDGMTIIIWFTAFVSGGLVLGIADIIRFLGQIEYNTRSRQQYVEQPNNYVQQQPNNYVQQSNYYIQ